MAGLTPGQAETLRKKKLVEMEQASEKNKKLAAQPPTLVKDVTNPENPTLYKVQAKQETSKKALEPKK